MGRFLPKILKYLQKNDFDIINFQEVSGGQWSPFTAKDLFAVFEKSLGYHGVLAAHFNNSRTYSGNATFFRKSFQLLDQKTIHLKKTRGPVDLNHRFLASRIKSFPRNALSLLLGKDNKQIRVINCHLAWGKSPEERAYHCVQNQRLINYVKTLPRPFILSGDFNLTDDSRTVKELDKLARNLTAEHKIKNTLNPRTHRVQKLFPPGYAVDFVYASKGVQPKKFQLIEDDLSDHLGLKLDFEI